MLHIGIKSAKRVDICRFISRILGIEQVLDLVCTGNDNGFSPIHLACKICDSHQLTVTLGLIAKTSKHLIDLLSEKASRTGATVFQIAVLHGNGKVIMQCISPFIGASPASCSQEHVHLLNIGDDQGFTPIHIAADKMLTHTVLKEMLQLAPSEQRLALLTARTKRKGDTPIRIAARKHCGKLVECLMALMRQEEIELLLNARNNNKGCTPIHMAACYDHHWSTIVKMLQLIPPAQRLTLLTTETFEGDTLIHMAARSGASVKYLTEALSPDYFQDLLITCKIDGQTPIHTAAAKPTASTLKGMLCMLSAEQIMPSLDMRDSNGDNAFHIAARGCGSEVIKFLCSSGTLKMNCNASYSS